MAFEQAVSHRDSQCPDLDPDWLSCCTQVKAWGVFLFKLTHYPEYPVAEDFSALAEDAAQVSVAQDEGTSDAKAIAQYNADVPLYAEYLVGCS